MKKVTTLVLYCFFFMNFHHETQASIRVALPNPLRVGDGCYNYDIGHLTLKEEKRLPNECSQAMCHIGGSITYVSCGEVMAADGCTVTPLNLSLPFPNCCAVVTCEIIE